MKGRKERPLVDSQGRQKQSHVPTSAHSIASFRRLGKSARPAARRGTAEFPGTATQFRALMERLQTLYPGEPIPHNFFGSLKTGEWKAPNEESLVFWRHRKLDYAYSTPPRPLQFMASTPVHLAPPYQIRDVVEKVTPGRETWVVRPRLPGGELDQERGAIIEAFEYSKELTPVEFLDGPGQWQPIGAPFQAFCEEIVKEVERLTPARDGAGKQPRGGRPGLSHDELIYRLAKAQEGEEIKRQDPSVTWKEIARRIGWKHGSNRSGVKLLEDARQRLRRLERSDPEGLLEKVAQFRREERL